MQSSKGQLKWAVHANINTKLQILNSHMKVDFNLNPHMKVDFNLKTTHFFFVKLITTTCTEDVTVNLTLSKLAKSIVHAERHADISWYY